MAMRNPARSISSVSRSQTTMLAGLTPACCRRSQTAATSSTFVEMPRPPRVFTFRLTVSSGPAMRRHAAMVFSALSARSAAAKRASMARSRRASRRRGSIVAVPEPRSNGSRATTTRDRRGISRRARTAAPARAGGGAEGHGASEALREKVPPAAAAKVRHNGSSGASGPAARSGQVSPRGT